MTMDDLRKHAHRWIAADPDPTTRAELADILARNDNDTLTDRFGTRLEFGTAGMRGIRGAGPARMNRLLVRLTTTALARVLLERVSQAGERGVVVGFDARHQSEALAHEACSVLAGHGIHVHFLSTVQPTPLIPFQVLNCGAAAGIVLTASHNPPQYNGYKVYWDDGAPIVPPIDQEISAAIDAIAIDSELPGLTLETAREKRLLIDCGSKIENAYLKATNQNLDASVPDIPIIYTPLHGVAGSLAMRALARGGFNRISVVAEQFLPDGNFPTLEFPNPEEPGVLQLAIEQARDERAELIIANDPDGDRLAIAALDEGEYRQLSGDQIGCLLADYILARQGDNLPTDAFVINTVVSSVLLQKIAASYGIVSAQTPTGLKWIWRRALEMEQAGGTFLFGYEESIGYSVLPQIRDKDGISAAVLFADLVRQCAADGETVFDRLDALYQRAGYSQTRQINIHLTGREGRERINACMQFLRQQPPSQLGEHQVESIEDLLSAARVDTDSAGRNTSTMPSSNLIQFSLDDGIRASFRPSGTEPKLKIYLERYVAPAGLSDLGAVKHTSSTVLDVLETAATAFVEAIN